MDKVESILKEHGPMLSGKLAKLYECKYKVTNITARKAVSKAKKPVMRVDKLLFYKGQYFYCLESQYMTTKFYKNICRDLLDNNVYKFYIRTIINHGGGISKEWLASYTASPIKNIKGHKSFNEVLDKLIEIKVIEELDEKHWKINKIICKFNASKMYNIENTKRRVINDFVKWINKSSIGTEDINKMIDENAEVANFQWTCIVRSGIQTSYNEDCISPGFILVDIITGKVTNIEDVQFFLQKLNIIRYLKNHGDIIGDIFPIILVDELEKEAYEELKSNKVIIGNIDNFFSRGYTSLLMEVINLYSNDDN